VTAGDALPPEAVLATDAAGAIDAIVGRRRAELARLSLTARTAAQRCERAEAALSAQPSTDPDVVPEDLLAVVDTMLRNAVRASEVGLGAARAEARHTVSVATAEAADSLHRIGIDPSVLPPARVPVAPEGHITPPPTAADLWRVASRPAPAPPAAAAGSEVPPAPPSPSPAPAPANGTPMAHVASPAAAPASSVEVGIDGSSPSPSVTTLLLDTPIVEPGEGTSAEVYDIFWQEVPGERRVRDRLLRRSPKEGA
jgi:hypothetical protein